MSYKLLIECKDFRIEIYCFNFGHPLLIPNCILVGLQLTFIASLLILNFFIFFWQGRLLIFKNLEGVPSHYHPSLSRDLHQSRMDILCKGLLNFKDKLYITSRRRTRELQELTFGELMHVQRRGLAASNCLKKNTLSSDRKFKLMLLILGREGMGSAFQLEREKIHQILVRCFFVDLCCVMPTTLPE